jgi:hypothetical protein
MGPFSRASCATKDAEAREHDQRRTRTDNPLAASIWNPKIQRISGGTPAAQGREERTGEEELVEEVTENDVEE